MHTQLGEATRSHFAAGVSSQVDGTLIRELRRKLFLTRELSFKSDVKSVKLCKYRK
jgi:hypothetical protein